MAAPWFKLYPRQFLTDSKVKVLSREHRSILMDLWCYCSEDGSIPADIQTLARLIGETPQVTRKAMEKLASFFHEEDGRLISKRMKAEADAYEEKCQKLRESASKGGLKKVANAKANATDESKQMLKQKGSEEEREEEKEKEKDKNPAAPPLRSRTTEPSGVKNPEKPKTPKTGPTVNEILADHDPASYWQLSRLFPGARSSNHRTAAVYWVAAINSGIAGAALVKAGKDFFESMPPDQIGKGAVPQMAKWLEQEGFRTFLPEDQPAPPPQVSEAERQGRMADAAAFLEAKCLNPALTFEAWRNNHAA